MWSSLLVADSGSETLNFSGLTVLPASELVAAVGEIELRGGEQHLLIAAPRALAEEAALQATIAVGRYPQLALATLFSAHAPLALMSAITSARASTDHPALGVDLVQRVLEQSWSGAWLPSVSKLTRPAPSLGQHLRSWLPGAHFLVRQSPDPAVFGAVGPQVVGRGEGERVLLTQEDAAPRSVLEQLSRVVGADTVRPIRLPGRWKAVYGTDHAGQLAVLPAQPSALLDRPTGICPSCGLRQSAVVCPFCRIVAADAGDPDRTVPVGGYR